MGDCAAGVRKCALSFSFPSAPFNQVSPFFLLGWLGRRFQPTHGDVDSAVWVVHTLHLPKTGLALTQLLDRLTSNL